MVNHNIVNVFMHSIKFSCLHFGISLILITSGERQYFDSMTLTIEGQNLTEYDCTITKSQIKKSSYLTEQCVEFDDNSDKIIFDSDITVVNTGKLVAGVLTCQLPNYADKEFFRIGFNDMCNYLQNIDDNFNQDYDECQLPMPIFVDNSSHFYDDVKQLTNQEIVFMKQLESYDDSNNNSNVNPFDIEMTRMNNLFKFADFLQTKRLSRIIAARQASLMTNMNRKQMIEWLFDTQNTKKQMNNNNGSDRSRTQEAETQSPSDYDSNNNNQECTNGENDRTPQIKELHKYNWGLLTQILAFLPCFDIRTFASISNEFYDFVNEWRYMTRNIDSMAKVLTNNNDSSCLSLTNQETLFYKPFLTLPQYKWNVNQNHTYDTLEKKTNTTLNLHSQHLFNFETLIFVGGNYNLRTLNMVFSINNGDHLIEVGIRVVFDEQFNTISFKFGKFAQRLNVLAKFRNVTHIQVYMHGMRYLKSFDNLIGINDIDNIKTIRIAQHSFPFIDFEQIYNINSQLEHLEITTKTKYLKGEANRVKNIQFLSNMKSLKRLILANNGLRIQCLDFTFLNNVTNLTELRLDYNQIECINNFMSIQNHVNLIKLDLQDNKISSLDLNAFQGTNLQYIDLSKNRLSSFNHDNINGSQLHGHSCLDFNSFNNITRLEQLKLDNNQIACIANFESIQQHTRLQFLNLENNYLLSPIDFTQFDESKSLMNSLNWIRFKNMNLKYTIDNNNCLDLKFLQFMPNVQAVDFSDNKIECVDNLSILQRKGIKLLYLNFHNNSLVSFDFADLIGANIANIYLQNNNLSIESLKNFDANTLSQISSQFTLSIYLTEGNDVDSEFRLTAPERFSII